MYNSVIEGIIADCDYYRVSFASKLLNRMGADLSAIRGER